MPVDYLPSSGYYRRAIREAAAVSDVAKLQEIALHLVLVQEALQADSTVSDPQEIQPWATPRTGECG